MERLENYHYAAILFSLAAITNGIDITRRTEGQGLARNTYYNISSADKKISYDYLFTTYPKHKNPYKRELYELLQYIIEHKKISVPSKISNDEEMLGRAVYFFNEYLHMRDVKAKFCFSQAQYDKAMDEVLKPALTFDEWRLETEKNFMPLCREHTILCAAETLTQLVCMNPKYVNKQEVMEAITAALKKSTFTDAQIKTMIEQSSKLPPEPQNNQMS